ncbi:MAG TPA: phospho-N-acetylmuramoyl-pentapeptide-transferase [Bacilli bacterium]|nr:phospho-N-acetylmuramoyl-pentapeptide-transferase [Bacilli bacterium]
MLILAKATLAIMLGFIIALGLGFILIPMLKKFKFKQNVSQTVGERHLAKQGTPTIGGLIFIIATLLGLVILYLRGSIEISANLIIVLFVFLSYALLGFVDDFLKIKYKNNKGIKISTKLLIQGFITLVFFYIFMRHGGEPNVTISSLGINIHLGWFYGIFIFFVLVGTTNAVNLSDGLDGLATGLSIIAFIAYGLITWNTTWMTGYQEVAIFSFILIGALMGFLVFNSHPAKIFMGDTGALALGGALGTIAIITRHEFSLLLIGGVFVIEALSSLIQIYMIKKHKKKVFLMAPIHHHFEQLGWEEQDIVKAFWIVGLLFAMAAIIYGVWIPPIV